jgi:membrane protease YdiL (CAAX protease family)
MRRTIKVLGFIGFVAAAFILTLAPQGVWSALLMANLKTGIALPWVAPVALGLLYGGWRLAGGLGSGPKAQAARVYRRANPVSGRTMGWALLANAFSIVALVSLWIVLRHLVRTPGNHMPDFSHYSPLLLAGLLACAGVVGAVSEEIGLRGYIQGRMERVAPWPVAVALMALVAAPGHALTQGFVWPTMLFYLLSDVTFGVTAYLARSILPGIVAHAAGLFVFFSFVWPHDQARELMTLGSASLGLWGLAASSAGFAALTVWAFVRLACAEGTQRRRVPASPTGLSAVHG